MICPNCKKENTENTKWCCYCGSLLELSPMEFELDETFEAPEQESVQPAPSRDKLKQGEDKPKRKTPDQPPEKKRRRRKKSHTLLYVLLSLLTLFAAFIACMVFIPPFQQFIQGILPIKSVNRNDFGSIVSSGKDSDGKVITFLRSDPSHIVTNDPTGYSYVDNEIILSFEQDVDAETINHAVSTYGGTIVGVNNYLNTYQVQFDKSYSYDELTRISEQLKSLLPAAEAMPNYYLSIGLDGNTPDDKEWVNEWGNIPAGKNWGAETIRAPEMWEYCATMDRNTVNVGVIDNQFYTDHEDLNFQEAFLNDFTPNIQSPNHGTHVAGTIAAKFNNSLGIAGIAGIDQYANLYGVSTCGVSNNPAEYVESGATICAWEAGLSYLIGAKHCRVINISQHVYYEDDSREEYYLSAKHLEKHLNKLIDKGYDFLIVKSSGNLRREVSVKNMFSFIDDPTVLSHVIIVGAAELGDCGDGNPYHVWADSNYGKEVDLIAPGAGIYSTVCNVIEIGTSGTFNFVLPFFPNSYSNKNGTSMAAPHVTGAAAAIWSVYPEITGPEMKQILCNTAHGSYGYAKDISSRYPMLDAYAAIQKAGEIVRSSESRHEPFEQPSEEQMVIETTLPKAWSEVYENFVLNQNVTYNDSGSMLMDENSFTVNGVQFFKGKYSEPKFSLYDMDGNGVPELIIYNGASALAAGAVHVFACENGQVIYLGKIGFRGCELYCCEGSSLQGLFCTDGNNGVFRTEYYELQNGGIVSQELDASSIDNDIRGYLSFYTIDEIRAMGWDAFINAAQSRTIKQSEEAVPVSVQRTEIPMDSNAQYTANIFLSNFSEQSAFERNGFDVSSPNYDELIQFVYLYCKINRRSELNIETTPDGSFYTITLDTVNNVLNRHFGITLSQEQASQIGSYRNGSFYFIAADGEAYNKLTVVNKMESLGNDTYELSFDIYTLNLDVYYSNNGAVDSGYYYTTADGARADYNLIWKASGTALVKPYDHDGIHTMQLIRYSVS